ncbi:DUF4145 domain-containing protein [Litchfieldia alkalitelluris]|uniref:DUF4145 domain-containing protein n=1 Tax=Litchfieldia alkalitelluris TaxID=304268 RepID=UPI00099686C8|nr:DUF4145 domain-containing protein [Litchfieldia alkalitelluris]
MSAIKTIFKREIFTCPYCNGDEKQNWFHFKDKLDKENKIDSVKIGASIALKGIPLITKFNGTINYKMLSELSFSICAGCTGYIIWKSGIRLYPNEITLPKSSKYMPKDAADIFEEARLIFDASPRSSSALLRLSLEMILRSILNENKKTLNQMIGQLATENIDEHTKKGLDILRYYGNQSVHTGEINIEEDKDSVIFLFDLINYIVDDLIGKKQKIDEQYSKIPHAVRKAILKRDNIEKPSKN